MIFSLLIIHDHDRTSSITRVQVLHTATWDFFTTYLPYRFMLSPGTVKEEIMTDVNDLLQELMATVSSNGVVDTSYLPMRHLGGILRVCHGLLTVCFDIFPFFCDC
jgi:hypothetical protein